MKINLVVLFVIFAIISTVCVSAKKRKQRKCKPENHKYYDPTKGRCRQCRKCPKGRGLTEDKKDIELDPVTKQTTTCYKCAPCPSGYYSDKKDHRACIPCKNCSRLRRVDKTPCNTTHNTVCGRCLPLHHDIHEKQSSGQTKGMPCQHCNQADPSIPECAGFTYAQSSILGSHATSVVPSETISTPLHRVHPIDAPIQHPHPEAIFQEQDIPVYLLPLGISVVAIFSVLLVGVVIWLKRKPTHSSTSRSPSNTGTSSEGIELTTIMPPTGTTDDRPETDGGSNTGAAHQPLLPVTLSSYQKMLIRRIGKKWINFAYGVGLSVADTDTLREEHWRNQGELIYQMLLKWERKSPTQANLHNACLALKTIGEPKLAKVLEQS